MGSIASDFGPHCTHTLHPPIPISLLLPSIFSLPSTTSPPPPPPQLLTLVPALLHLLPFHLQLHLHLPRHLHLRLLHLSVRFPRLPAASATRTPRPIIIRRRQRLLIVILLQLTLYCYQSWSSFVLTRAVLPRCESVAVAQGLVSIAIHSGAHDPLKQRRTSRLHRLFDIVEKPVSDKRGTDVERSVSVNCHEAGPVGAVDICIPSFILKHRRVSKQTSTATMLQTRPASAGGILQQTSQGQHHPFGQPASHRNGFHGINGLQMASYRGSLGHVAPFQFTGKPGMPGNPWATNQRLSSAPIPQSELKSSQPRFNRYPSTPSVSTTSSTASSDVSSRSHRSGSKDDMNLAASANARQMINRAPRPHSSLMSSASASTPNLALPSSLAPAVKPSPDRYRRPANRRADSTSSQSTPTPLPATTTSSLPNVMNFYGAATSSPPTEEPLVLTIPQFASKTGDISSASAGSDTQSRPSSRDQASARYRRRSVQSLDLGELGAVPSSGTPQAAARQLSSADGKNNSPNPSVDPSPVHPLRPMKFQNRNDSSESVQSAHSSRHSRPGSVSHLSLVF